MPVKTVAFKAVVDAVGRTLCSYLWWCLADAEGLGAHSACCAAGGYFFLLYKVNNFFFSFFEWRRKWGYLLRLFHS